MRLVNLGSSVTFLVAVCNLGARQGFLEFIYTDKTEILPEYTEDWLRIADMYQLDGLKSDAGAAILKTLTVENAYSMLSVWLIFTTLKI